jgi:hypothetical protein
MKTSTLMLIAPVIALATLAPAPAHAGVTVGVGISNHGFGIGFGASTWGLWGSSWSTASWSVGFSATLSGYGEWVHVNGLGQVWRPWVSASWQPYSHGRWVWTVHGWTWVAYEPWGWVPHHYGNWAYTTIGWVWSPGYTYHPGNVVWVSSGAYLGWVPCAPRGWSHAHRGFHHGWNEGYAWGRHGGYRQGYSDGWRDARYATWVPRGQVTADNVSSHRVGHEVATRSVARSRVTPMPSAPSKTDVERMVGRQVPETRVAERTAMIDGREARVVRPEGQRSSVERYGVSTVRTALAPAARERASGRSVPAATTASTSRERIKERSVSSSRAPVTVSSRTASRSKVGETRTQTTTRSSRRAPVTEPNRAPAVYDGSGGSPNETAPGFTRRSSTQAGPESNRKRATESASRSTAAARSGRSEASPTRSRATESSARSTQRKAASQTRTRSSADRSSSSSESSSTAPRRTRRNGG